MTSEKKDKILYWVFTAPFLLLMFVSSISYLLSASQIAEGIARLGYPLYMLKILGTAKLLGAVAIAYGRFVTLKEWAYAGFVINLAGATASHIFSGDTFGDALTPMVILAIILGSYFYWKKCSVQLALNR